MAGRKGSCGGTPRVGRKGDPKPRRGGDVEGEEAESNQESKPDGSPNTNIGTCGAKRAEPSGDLAERLHRARHTNSGLSEYEARTNWSQHSSASQAKVWGGVASEAKAWMKDMVEKHLGINHKEHRWILKDELMGRLK